MKKTLLLILVILSSLLYSCSCGCYCNSNLSQSHDEFHKNNENLIKKIYYAKGINKGLQLRDSILIVNTKPPQP